MDLRDVPTGFKEIDLPEWIEARRNLIKSYEGERLLVLREGDSVHESGTIAIPIYLDKDIFCIRGNFGRMTFVNYTEILSLHDSV
ncbi:MAG: hypothetical protein KKF67_00410 [Nanoarchaeota archaeon]|nr:hypothetical protein [Nanoarchaeota archaeon]